MNTPNLSPCQSFIQQLPQIPLKDEITNFNQNLYLERWIDELEKFTTRDWNIAKKRAAQLNIPLEEVMIGFGYKSSEQGWNRFRKYIKSRSNAYINKSKFSYQHFSQINEKIVQAIEKCLEPQKGFIVYGHPSGDDTSYFVTVIYIRPDDFNPKNVKVTLRSKNKIHWNNSKPKDSFSFWLGSSYKTQTTVILERLESDDLKSDIPITAEVSNISNDNQLISRMLLKKRVEIAEAPPLKPPFKYLIRTYTDSKKANSKTDNKFYVKLIGVKETSDWLSLNQPGKDDRELGQIDEYSCVLRYDIGELRGVLIEGRLKKGKKHLDDWRLTRIVVEDLKREMKHEHRGLVKIGDGSKEKPKPGGRRKPIYFQLK